MISVKNRKKIKEEKEETEPYFLRNELNIISYFSLRILLKYYVNSFILVDVDLDDITIYDEVFTFKEALGLKDYIQTSDILSVSGKYYMVLRDSNDNYFIVKRRDNLFLDIYVLFENIDDTCEDTMIKLYSTKYKLISSIYLNGKSYYLKAYTMNICNTSPYNISFNEYRRILNTDSIIDDAFKSVIFPYMINTEFSYFETKIYSNPFLLKEICNNIYEEISFDWLSYFYDFDVFGSFSNKKNKGMKLSFNIDLLQ